MKGLYVHIPFCVKKCEYCDFVSFPCMESRYLEYIKAVEDEMSQYKGQEIDTIFIGGGTPSVLPAELIERLCLSIKTNFKITDNAEFSMEINPGTITDNKISAMIQGGINRVSVGVQSFDDKELKAAGRIHSSKTAYDTVVKLYKSGFKNINIDIMESLPCQTKESFVKTLKTAIELPVKHISVYSLIIEDGTPIKEKYDSGVYKEPDEDTDRELYKYTGEYLKSKGFNRYEISNYAVCGYESKHNMRYWNCDEYIGIGLAAHSYIDGVRFYNTSDLDKYINGFYKDGEKEILTQEDKMGEFMMLGLRMTKGVSANEFNRRFGVDIKDVYGTIIKKYIELGFMKENNDCYSFTEKGINISNSILCEFI